MTDAKDVVKVFGAILMLLIGSMVISAISDPHRVIVNSLPDTTPDVKTPTNQALYILDDADAWKVNISMNKNLYSLMIGLGIPSAVIGGLVWRKRSG